MAIADMTDEQKDQMLGFLTHRMEGELRGRLMRALPEAYNAFCGEEIVRVVRAKDADKAIEHMGFVDGVQVGEQLLGGAW